MRPPLIPRWSNSGVTGNSSCHRQEQTGHYLTSFSAHSHRSRKKRKRQYSQRHGKRKKQNVRSRKLLDDCFAYAAPHEGHGPMLNIKGIDPASQSNRNVAARDASARCQSARALPCRRPPSSQNWYASRSNRTWRGTPFRFLSSMCSANLSRFSRYERSACATRLLAPSTTARLDASDGRECRAATSIQNSSQVCRYARLS